MDDVRPGADLMFVMGPSDIVVARETPVVAESWVPSLGVAKVGVTRNIEIGDAAVPQVRAVVRTWNS